MSHRDYTFWAKAGQEFLQSCEDFASFLDKTLMDVHQDHPYLNCKIIDTSNQLNPKHPPCSFVVKIRVTKVGEDKSKNFNTKSLLNKNLRTSPLISDFELTRVNS